MRSLRWLLLTVADNFAAKLAANLDLGFLTFNPFSVKCLNIPLFPCGFIFILNLTARLAELEGAVGNQTAPLPAHVFFVRSAEERTCCLPAVYVFL